MDGEKLLNLLVSIKEKCSAAEERIRKNLGLTVAEYRGLMCLRSEEKISCRELSSRMNLSVSRGSRVIENLFKKGYLKRVDCASDRRSKNLWLTSRGAQIRHQIDRQIQDCEERLITDIPEDRLVKFKADLKTLVDRF